MNPEKLLKSLDISKSWTEVQLKLVTKHNQLRKEETIKIKKCVVYGHPQETEICDGTYCAYEVSADDRYAAPVIQRQVETERKSEREWDCREKGGRKERKFFTPYFQCQLLSRKGATEASILKTRSTLLIILTRSSAQKGWMNPRLFNRYNQIVVQEFSLRYNKITVTSCLLKILVVFISYRHMLI